MSVELLHGLCDEQRLAAIQASREPPLLLVCESPRFDGFDLGLGESFRDNSGSGHAHGGELEFDASPVLGWTLRGAYGYHWSEHGPVTPEGDLSLIDGRYPRYPFNLRSDTDLGRGFELDLAPLVAVGLQSEIGSESWRSDLRLGWNQRPDLCWSPGVEGLYDARCFGFPFLEIRCVFDLQLSWTPGPGQGAKPLLRDRLG